MFDKLINKAAACLRGRRTHSTQGAGDLAAFCVTISAGNIYEVTGARNEGSHGGS